MHRPMRRIVVVAALLASALAVAILMTWSADYCRRHTADSLLPALISTQSPGWYYWGQNRFGNLLPILARGIVDIDLNLRFQILLRALSGALGMTFFVALLRPRAPFLASYAAALTAILMVERNSFSFQYFVDAQPYGTCFAILAAAVCIAGAAERLPRLRLAAVSAAVFALVGLALWVNLSVVTFVLPLFLGLALLRRSRTYAALSGMVVVAFVVLSMHAARLEGPGYGLNWALWPALRESVRMLLPELRPIPALVVAAGGVLAALFSIRLRGDASAAIAIAAAALICFVVTASIDHVANNLFYPRYFLMPVTALVALSAMLLLDWLWGSGETSRLAPLGVAASLAVMLLAAGWSTLPLDRSCPFTPEQRSAAAPEVAALANEKRATFIGGDNYWTIWPAVFMAVRDSGRSAFGLGYRGNGAQKAIVADLRTNREPTLLCFGHPLAQCITQLETAIGRPSSIVVTATERGALKSVPDLPWTSARLTVSLPDLQPQPAR